jgi:hypothetical protein
VDNEEVLRAAGFVQIHERALWVSRDRRMAFSHEVLRDHDSQWLKDMLADKVPETEFVFHFNEAPKDPKVCREILIRIGLTELQPLIRVATFRSR